MTEIDLQALKDYCTFQAYPSGRRLNVRDAAHELRLLLAEVIDDYGCPDGFYVSGGVDSAVVAACCGREAPAYTAAVEGHDESPFAAQVADHLGLIHHVLPITSETFAGAIRPTIRALGMPIAGPGSVAQYLLAESAPAGLIFSGEGGDEHFGGYARYQIAMGEPVDGYEQMRPTGQGVESRYCELIDRSDLLADAVPMDIDGSLRITKQWVEAAGQGLQRMMHFDLAVMFPALAHVDRAVNAAHGIRVKAPLADPRIAAWVQNLPDDYRIRDGLGKYLLRLAVERDLPKEVVWRKDKCGLGIPIGDWLRSGPVRSFAQDCLGRPEARGREYIDNGKVLTWLDDEPRFGRRVWGALALEVYMQEVGG